MPVSHAQHLPWHNDALRPIFRRYLRTPEELQRLVTGLQELTWWCADDLLADVEAARLDVATVRTLSHPPNMLISLADSQSNQ